MLNFSQALEYLLKGERIFRSSWNDLKIYLYLLKEPNTTIVRKNNKDIGEWQPTVEDILAKDWYVKNV